ncbi:MAG: extracellular solute-binding protein [Hyphomicrobiaceae bacterium]|nr:extracellular solute-binding protein [Hyphomicrobiaceae bacterium]
MATLIFTTLPPMRVAAEVPAHGYSPIHELKYPSDFPHFDYVNPDAPKGGGIRWGRVGTFDSLNTLRYPGTTPADLRRHLYDTLIVASADEAAGYYGLLAEMTEVSDDLSWVRFKLRSDARWHDGAPITAEDVVFTFRTLASQGAPYYRQVLRLFTVEQEAQRVVVFRSKKPGDREFVRIVGTLPIHPAHFWKDRNAKGKSLEIPLGSGPYRVKTVTAGRSLSLERVKDYWARSLPVNVGRYNFDAIGIEYYRDRTVALEAFTAGEFDVWRERDAARWSSAYKNIQRNGIRIVRRTFRLNTPGTTATLVFNLRRARFQDRRVRQAVALAYNFDWTNKVLFSGRYKPVESFFGNTQLAADGPISTEEKDVLAGKSEALPQEAISRPGPAVRDGFNSDRSALRQADTLLKEAGYRVANGSRIDPATGKQFIINVVFSNPSLVRVLGPLARNLERLGIKLSYPSLEPTSAVRKLLDHDFDIADLTLTPKLVAGNAERLLWGSALADRQGSYALAGAKDPVLDTAIAAMLKARNWDTLQTGARLFDRTLRWQRYVVPLWRSNEVWIAHWDKFSHPKIVPDVYPSYADRWWAKPPSAN